MTWGLSGQQETCSREVKEIWHFRKWQQELVLGIMYYSVCSISMHVNFIKNGDSVYDYYFNNDGTLEEAEAGIVKLFSDILGGNDKAGTAAE